VVTVFAPAASSNTVPSLLIPPALVVPYRLPLRRRSARPEDFARCSLRTSPSVVSEWSPPRPRIPFHRLCTPPSSVVPYRLPLASKITAATAPDRLPVLELNQRGQGVRPRATSNTVPYPLRCAAPDFRRRPSSRRDCPRRRRSGPHRVPPVTGVNENQIGQRVRSRRTSKTVP